MRFKRLHPKEVLSGRWQAELRRAGFESPERSAVITPSIGTSPAAKPRVALGS